MSLVTRCPVCATAFRVQRSQLAARAGKVRCGKCGTVFDGVSALVEEGLEALQLEPSPQLGLFDPSRRAEQEEEALPEFLLREEPQPRSRLLWGLLLVVAVTALAAQAAYRFRTDIAALGPAARDAVESACKALRCRIAVPRRPDLMSIESSDLQADPRETRDVAGAHREEVARLTSALDSWQAAQHLAYGEAGAAADRRVEDTLRALGYAGDH